MRGHKHLIHITYLRSCVKSGSLMVHVIKFYWNPRMLICLCIVWLLSHYDGKIEYLQQKAYKPQSLKYLLSGPILKKICWILHLASEKVMAPHSSTLAWQIPWTEEPGRLQSLGSLRVGHDWMTSLSLFTVMHWRRKWQPTPVFLPGESQGWGSLVGCRL